MISQTAKYALRTVVFLANNLGTYTKRTVIAQATKVPSEYLLKVLGSLEGAGIVESRRGPGGGFLLVKTPSQVTALEVVMSVDAIPRIKSCPLGISNHHRLCPLHRLLDNVSAQVEATFQQTTIAQLMVTDNRHCEFPSN